MCVLTSGYMYILLVYEHKYPFNFSPIYNLHVQCQKQTIHSHPLTCNIYRHLIITDSFLNPTCSSISPKINPGCPRENHIKPYLSTYLYVPNHPLTFLPTHPHTSHFCLKVIFKAFHIIIIIL